MRRRSFASIYLCYLYVTFRARARLNDGLMNPMPKPIRLFDETYFEF